MQGRYRVNSRAKKGWSRAMEAPVTTRTSLLNDRKISHKLPDLKAGLAKQLAARSVKYLVLLYLSTIGGGGSTKSRIPLVQSSK